VKILYFDIDGSLLREDTATVKPALANGRFERLVSEAGFDRLVCVGNIVTLVQQLPAITPDIDGADVIFTYCGGAFADLDRFRATVEWVDSPERRARHLDRAADWWYLDDLARFYLEQESMGELLEAELGGRIYVPRPNGDGSGVAAWLTGVA